TVLASGKELTGPIALRQHLLSQEDQLPMAITKRLMMYALNREVEYFDMPQVREIVREAAEEDYTFAAIVRGVVNSDAFRMQGPGGHENKDAEEAAVASAN